MRASGVAPLKLGIENSSFLVLTTSPVGYAMVVIVLTAGSFMTGIAFVGGYLIAEMLALHFWKSSALTIW